MEAKELIERYVQIRDKIAAINKECDEKIKPLQSLKVRIEAALAAKMEADNLDSMRTEAGTAFFKESTSATVADWDAVFKWIMDNEAHHFIEHRVNKTAVEEFIKESGGDLPPGINYSAVKVVQVRRG